MKVRKASHSGSWYTSSRNELDLQLANWLNQASKSHFPARAIIAPHAGYEYCGACGAFAYKQVDPTNIRRVFILGPSHHFNLGENCALTCADVYETPFYNLTIDKNVFQALNSTGEFVELAMRRDEDEHSIEMHLPYIAKVMESRREAFTIVPILVGALSAAREAVYGKILAPYLSDPQNLFVVSSDFCHWGKRFRYTYYDKAGGEIWKSIENLDHMGMKQIESLQPKEFTDYLRQYGNTICGRHPIGVLLNAVATLRSLGTNGGGSSGGNFSIKFLQYAQSSRCFSMDDSSVSYAAASLVG